MQNLVEKIEVIEFNNRDYWIQPIQKYPAVIALKGFFLDGKLGVIRVVTS